MKILELHFDYLSPFAYLASIEVPAIAARHGAELVLRPVLFPALLDHFGQRGPAEIPPKALHAFRAALRHALPRGVPIHVPRYHPFSSLLALRTTLAASEADRGQVMRALYDLGWARGGDLADAGEIAGALGQAGLPGGELVARASAPEVKALLRSETERAIGRGVFGVPTVIVEDEVYWGVDQLEHVERHLAGGNPLNHVDFASLLPRGVGAWRPGAGAR